MRFELDFPTIQDSYHAQTDKTAWLAGAWPSFSFYRRMFSIVWKAARLAKKGTYTDQKWCRSSFEILRALEYIGTEINIEGVDNIGGLEKPCVIIGNHMSTLETFLLPYMLCPQRRLTFIVKESLVCYPVFKHIMISRDPIVVGRDNPKQDFLTVLKDGEDRLNRNFSVVVFPQTTRMTKFDRTQFNSIGVKLAKRANVPIVPLALKTDCWGNGFLIKDFGKIDPSKSIYFNFGTAMEIEGNGKSQQELVISHIENCLHKWTNNNQV